MISCGEPFEITVKESNYLEFSGMTKENISKLELTDKQKVKAEEIADSGDLNNIGLQIKDLIDIYDRCIEQKK